MTSETSAMTEKNDDIKYVRTCSSYTQKNMVEIKKKLKQAKWQLFER